MEPSRSKTAGTERTIATERPKSHLLYWSLGLAIVPTTIVVLLLSLLLFPRAVGEAELTVLIVAAMVVTYAGIPVLLCCLAGVITAIVHFRRTRSHWAWAGLCLSILSPVAILAVFRLDSYLERQRYKSVWAVYDLHEAASEGDLKTVEKLEKEKDTSINRMLHGYAPLHRAVAAGDLDMVEYLLQNGANANASYGGFEKPLHVLAASHWCPCEDEPCTCVKMLDTLIKHGADINAKCDAYRTDIREPNSLPKMGPWTPLEIAMDVNNVTQIKHLIKHRNDVNVESNGVPALTSAVRLGQTDTVKFLIAGGADVNFGGKLNCTPLMAAASRVDIPMMEFLLSHGADPNVTDGWGQTLLHRALYSTKCNELVEGIKFLLAIGMDIEAQDKYGQTPLHRAAEHCTAAVQLLLSHGANVNARTRAGQTPLHLAAAKYNRPNVRALLDAGADVNAKSPDGLTPLYKALARCAHTSVGQFQRETAEILLQHGAKIDASIVYQKGKTPPDPGCLWKVTNDKEGQQEQQMIELLEKYSESNQQGL